MSVPLPFRRPVSGVGVDPSTRFGPAGPVAPAGPPDPSTRITPAPSSVTASPSPNLIWVVVVISLLHAAAMRTNAGGRSPADPPVPALTVAFAALRIARML